MRRTCSIVGAIVCVTIAGACSTDPAAPQSDRPATSTPADRTGRIQIGDPPTLPPPTVALVPGTDVPSADASQPSAAISDVRIESDPVSGVDRVVYSFTGEGIPFWKVGYVAEAVPHRGGPTLSVSGRTIMQVDVMDTSLPARHLYGDATPMTGPQDSRVAQLYLLPDTRDGNGITQSFIGIRSGPAPFEVVTVDDPPQLIVEFR